MTPAADFQHTHVSDDRATATSARQSLSGVTLPELLTSLTIMVGLAAIALPNLMQPVSDLRLRSVAGEFIDALSLANSEATRRRTTVVVCPRSTTATCQATATNWNNGWLLFQDSNNNAQYDAGEEMIARRNSLPSTMLMGRDTQSPITAIPGGMTTSSATGTRTIHMSVSGSSVTRYVVVSRIGRARLLDATQCATTNSGCTL